MASSKTIEGPTPNGGVKATIFYMDASGNIVDESVATNSRIVEYGPQGEILMTTYGTRTPAPVIQPLPREP